MDAVALNITPEVSKSTQLAAVEKQAPTEHEIARFTEVMESRRPAGTTQVQIVHQSYLTQQGSKPMVSLGDTILSRLQTFGQGFEGRIKALEKRLNDPVRTPGEANKLYFEICQISLQQQMALAVTSKVNKNAESLLKAQ